MTLKTINLLTSSLTKNFLIFLSLTLSLSTFARDVHPHLLKKHYIILEHSIDYDNTLPPNINTENEINSLELPTISDEDETSLLVSPTINTENIFSHDSTSSISTSSTSSSSTSFSSISSNSSNGEIIFGEEYQEDYPVFDDDNDLSFQENPLIDAEIER